MEGAVKISDLLHALKGVGNTSTSLTRALGNAAANKKNSSYYDIMEQQQNTRGRGETVGLILAFGIIIIVSLFGNVLVCHVIIKNRRMRTVTNLFITNLAIADIVITTVNIPFNIARFASHEWPFGTVMCHLVNFSLMVSVYVSTFTLASIALDRHRVIIHPLKRRISTKQGTIVVAIVWMLAIALSLPYAIFSKVQQRSTLLHKVDRCIEAYPNPTDKYAKGIKLATILAQYCIPLAIISVSYGRIVKLLWLRGPLGEATDGQQTAQAKGKRKTIKMLILVVVVFALCWMPLNLYHLLTDLRPELFRHNSIAFFVCYWIALSSVCYNPFIYCWLNEHFRNEVKKVFPLCCTVRPNSRDNSRYRPCDTKGQHHGKQYMLVIKRDGSTSSFVLKDTDIKSTRSTEPYCGFKIDNVDSPFLLPSAGSTPRSSPLRSVKNTKCMEAVHYLNK
ncbi:unnamed protein product [Owenia fusiformis]|uniref:G-protein coupled receptors family 1 profile domain-containing protein n=1 Tax=Owenia fusiformis TaxID=6347 RepID=A0A8S4NS27_OWEFU|nr:unnamed protein product [Owenia fusiformis]